MAAPTRQVLRNRLRNKKIRVAVKPIIPLTPDEQKKHKTQYKIRTLNNKELGHAWRNYRKQLGEIEGKRDSALSNALDLKNPTKRDAAVAAAKAQYKVKYKEIMKNYFNL